MEYCALCGNFIDEDPLDHWERCKAGDWLVPTPKEGN